jgi:biotin synthase-like enzyme
MPAAADVRAIHDQPLRELARAAAALHRRRWEAARPGPRGARRIALETCDCGRDPAHPVPASAEAVLSEARAARAAGQGRYCLAAQSLDLEAMLVLVRGIRALGLAVCVDGEVAGVDEARRLKAAGCSTLCRCFRTEAPWRGTEAAAAGGLQVCFRCLLGREAAPEARLAFLQALVEGPAQPDVLHLRLAEGGTPAREVIRFIATARLLLPGCRIHLALYRASLDPRSRMMAHLCGADDLTFVPHGGVPDDLGSYADQTCLPGRPELR